MFKWDLLDVFAARCAIAQNAPPPLAAGVKQATDTGRLPRFKWFSREQLWHYAEAVDLSSCCTLM